MQRLDSVKNSEADYKSRIASVRKSKRLADAGRIQEIELDRAVQTELQARQGWIGSIQNYKRQLDAFKNFIGLTPDANIELDPNELELLLEPTKDMIQQIAKEDDQMMDVNSPHADPPRQGIPQSGNPLTFQLSTVHFTTDPASP